MRAAVRGARRLPPSGRLQTAEGGDAAAAPAASRHRAGTEGPGVPAAGREGFADGRSSLQLHGQCYDAGGEPEAGVTAVLELGAPLEMIQLLQTPWEERFKVRKQNAAGASVGFRSSNRVKCEKRPMAAGRAGLSS